MRNVFDYAKGEDLSDLETVPYVNVKVRVYDFDDEIPLYPCYKDPSYGYVYTTPGFNQDFNFLLRRRDLTSNPTLYAIVEPRPAIDESFNDQRHLEKYFVKAYRELTSSFFVVHLLCREGWGNMGPTRIKGTD